MNPDPIVITGLGIISALGNGVDATLAALKQGRSGVGPITYLKTAHTEFPVGEVTFTNDELSVLAGVDAQQPMVRTSLMGIVATAEALDMAHIDPSGDIKAAFISGTTVGGMDKSEDFYDSFLNDDLHIDFINTHDCGASSELIARCFPLFNFISTPSTACSSAANSIILGARMLLSGETDVVVAGGSECLTRFHLNGFNTLMILDRERCRPFDRERAGLNLGEGAAYVVMERLSHALQRGAQPVARLVGWGNACDAHHQTASSPDGEGAYRAMKQALDRAGIAPAEVDYINAHGTGTPNNDESETRAMQRLFGDSVPPVSSTKWATGHTTSASGSIESVISILALRNGFMPMNGGFSNPIDGGIVPVTAVTDKADMKYVLCNSFGFGGNDSSLLFTR